jgi:hypothetical protein
LGARCFIPHQVSTYIPLQSCEETIWSIKRARNVPLMEVDVYRIK